jgi:hypothetical protein
VATQEAACPPNHLMQFTWLNSQGVRSESGIEVQFVDRYTIDYREPDLYLRLKVSGEIHFGASGRFAIGFSRQEMQSHWAFRTLPADRQKQVEQNLIAALNFQSIDAVFD